MSAVARGSAAALVVACTLLGCGNGSKSGEAAAKADDAGPVMDATPPGPKRCAAGAIDDKGPAQDVDPVGAFVLTGAVLRATKPTAGPVVIGVVGDARGATGRTVKQLERTAAVFAKRGVSVVVSLGGMGKDRAAIERALTPLLADRRWLVVAMPGDREAVGEHSAAIASLAKAGHRIVDGLDARILDLGVARVGGMPGVERAEQLVAGRDGCVHDDTDADALAKALARRPAPRVWLGYAPPRQHDPEASDVAIGGIHVGETSVARGIAAAKVAVVVHGLVDEAAIGLAPGLWRKGKNTAILAAGAIEAIPVRGRRGGVARGAAVTLELRAAQIRWQPIRF